ncbi:prostaglandin E synthase-like isoform X2 [Scyliorhinus torazame]|uniref:prostaglandin E synthase-like isoform X2 n=1 Tax=Scyliorhinus torazame TaxID=75743 RepID=UPI003B5B7421
MDNPVFACYTFYSTLLILKLYTLAVITGQLRLHKKAFINPEDALRHGGLEYYRTDPDVERSRRLGHVEWNQKCLAEEEKWPSEILKLALSEFDVKDEAEAMRKLQK